MPHFHDHITTLYQFTKPVLDKKMSIFEEYGVFKHHYYMVHVKLGFTGVYIIFLISAQKHRLWVLIRTASPRRFQCVPTIYVLSRNMENISIFI